MTGSFGAGVGLAVGTSATFASAGAENGVFITKAISSSTTVGKAVGQAVGSGVTATLSFVTSSGKFVGGGVGAEVARCVITFPAQHPKT